MSPALAQPQAEVVAEREAEDALVSHLSKMPSTVRTLVALITARFQWSRWEEERRKMINRNDPRLAYDFNFDEMIWMIEASLTISWDDTILVYLGEQSGELLLGIPPDAAAWVAYKVARWCSVRWPVEASR
jgi:hypothetical protein